MRILFDTSARAIEYQLGRLTNDELARVERRDDDRKYRPVYVAILTRKGLGREYFDEALAALERMDKASRTRVLLDALPAVQSGDAETADKLVRFLLAQPLATLRGERATFARAVDESSHSLVLRAAYGAMMLADGGSQGAWQAAAGREGHLVELLRSVPNLGEAPELRASLFEPIATLLGGTADAAARTAALAALGWTRPDAAAFRLLAREVIEGTDDGMRDAAVQSLHLIPEAAWPADGIEPLARAVVSAIGRVPADRRTDPPIVEATRLGEKLVAAMRGDSARRVRHELRALGVQVVRIETIPEKMAFDLKWFAVEAGKRVQIILYNPDAMSHNLLIGKPGSLKEIGTAASTMSLPTDPDAKPYVPDTPLVLQATRLINWGETARLGFVAPRQPGDYIFVCTFPGHWVRMYGVMLVVEDLEKWEANRTTPVDPMTNRPFESQRN